MAVEIFFEMRITKVLQKEKENKGIILHKEGIFWRAYEVSAYVFASEIKSYNVKVKYYKNVNREVVYLGFPATYLDTIIKLCGKKGYTVQEQSESEIVIKGSIEAEGYAAWKKDIVQAIKQTDVSKENEISSMDISREIVAYPLASKTPMEAQHFLYEIQLKINGII